jgi:probable HAF family extracellular repeat protein
MPRLSRIKTGLCATLLLGVGVAALARPAHADIASPAVTNLGDFGNGSWGSEAGWGGGNVTDSGVVVGDAATDSGYTTNHAFRWTASGGLQDLGTLGGSDSWAYGVSADGSVVVGGADLSNGNSNAFRWTEATGMVDIGTLGGSYSFAYGVSADGSVVVGQANLSNGNENAFRWTQATGMVDIDNVGGTNSIAYDVSADGSVVVGAAQFNGGNSDAFRWTQATGMVDLGNLGGTNASSSGYASEAFAISADDSTIVGDSFLANNSTDHAFRWTQAGGMVDLGTLGGNVSIAYSVSANGSVVVGYGLLADNSTYHAFRWTQASGMADLNTLLSNAGVNMTGITLNFAQGISPNGKYIVGEGTFPDSSYEAFLVCYDPNSGCVGLTTGASQQAATQDLSAHQRAALIESRSTTNEMLGFTRPMDNSNYTYAGGMFGSAVGYTGGQYAARGVTLLGGIAYGAQDYPGISQSDAPTVAAAARYTFDVPFGEKRFYHPFVEVGGSVTPQADLTISRSYANGAGTSTGTGSTEATSWAEYGRLGMVWNLTGYDQLTGYGEMGQQYMAFNAYTETTAQGNPFPASVDGGVLRLDVARAGASWTHKFDGLQLEDDLNVPISFTLAGAAAHAINEHAGLTATVAGVGASTAANETDTWGEFGGRLEGQLTTHVALDLDLTGTTGSGALGTVFHGGVGLTYWF